MSTRRSSSGMLRESFSDNDDDGLSFGLQSSSIVVPIAVSFGRPPNASGNGNCGNESGDGSGIQQVANVANAGDGADADADAGDGDDRSTSFSFASAAFSFFGHRQNQGDENNNNDNNNGRCDDHSSSILVPVTVPVVGPRRPTDNRGDDDDNCFHGNDANANDYDNNNENDNGRGPKKDDIYLESSQQSRAELGSMDTSQRSTTSLASSLYSPKSCHICLEKYKVGDEITWSRNDQCAHVFHLDCILDWLMDNDQCPVCREGYLE